MNIHGEAVHRDEHGKCGLDPPDFRFLSFPLCSACSLTGSVAYRPVLLFLKPTVGIHRTARRRAVIQQKRTRGCARPLSCADTHGS